MRSIISSMPFFYPQKPQHLSNEEFESLKRVVQLLRISQLRYIVQKFSIPASGNKTKLLGLLLSVFHSLRYDRVLIDIYNEINNILSKKEANSIKQLEIITRFDPNFQSPPNPLQCQSDPPFMLGPIFVPPRESSGKFGFMYSDSEEDLNTLINISFLFPGGKAQQFAFKGEINGFPFEISIDDPYPQPIDVTEYINVKTTMNTLNIKSIKTSSPMMICIREYKYCGIQNMMNQIVGRNVDPEKEDFDVHSSSCQHRESFSLSNFLSNSFATGSWKCPICDHLIDPLNLSVIRAHDITKEKMNIHFTMDEESDSSSSIMSPSEAFVPIPTASNASISIKAPISTKLSKSSNASDKFDDIENSTENNSSNTNDIFKMNDIMDTFGWDTI